MSRSAGTFATGGCDGKVIMWDGENKVCVSVSVSVSVYVSVYVSVFICVWLSVCQVHAWNLHRQCVRVCVCGWVGGWVCLCACVCVCVCVVGCDGEEWIYGESRGNAIGG